MGLKKFFIPLVIIIGALAVFFAMPASAQVLGGLSDNPCDVCEFAKLLSNIKNIALEIAGPVVIVMIIIGGIRMTASTTNDSREQAKKIISSAIIGLIIVLMAWGIISSIIMALYGRNFDANIWTIQCPDDTTCEKYFHGLDVPGTTATPGEPGEYGGQIVGGSMGQASPALGTFVGCMRDYVPKGETWTITSVMDNDHPDCKAGTKGNPKNCSTCNCKGGFTGKTGGNACPDKKCDDCSSACSHAQNSCHYGGRTCTDGSYAIDIQPATSESAMKSAANKCGGAWFKTHLGTGQNPHVHISIGSREGCECD